MQSVIIIAEGLHSGALEKLLGTHRSTATTEIIVVAANKPSNLSGTFVTTDGLSLPDALRRAATGASSDTLILVDAGYEFVGMDELSLAELGASLHETITLIPTAFTAGVAELQDTSAPSLLQAYTAQSELPIAMIGCTREFAMKSGSFDGETVAQVFGNLFTNATVDGESIGTALTQVSVVGAPRISSRDRAALLRRLVNAQNVEDLFPNHSWSEHSTESAAACYHTLAAMFLKLGDAESAADCLTIGDRLESSPRGFALRAILAERKGEMLGAVANMVSSLQQYEVRKRNDGQHYLQFTPRNLELINEKLNAGLDALNKRNNAAAFAHFREAVFNFDPFFEDLGVTE